MIKTWLFGILFLTLIFGTMTQIIQIIEFYKDHWPQDISA